MPPCLPRDIARDLAAFVVLSPTLHPLCSNQKGFPASYFFLGAPAIGVIFGANDIRFTEECELVRAKGNKEGYGTYQFGFFSTLLIFQTRYCERRSTEWMVTRVFFWGAVNVRTCTNNS